MDPQVQRVLDQESGGGELSPEQAEELAAAEALIAGVLRSVPRAPIPDLALAVMQRIQDGTPVAATRTSPSGVRAMLDWFWKPRPVALQWRPAYALGLAAVLAFSAAAGGWWRGSNADATTPARQVLVQFRLDAPAASAVTLAGDFTSWQPVHKLTRSAPGIWTVVIALEPGVHDYAFIVDGERWTPDPMAPAVADGFGGLNSRLAVLSPDRTRPL